MSSRIAEYLEYSGPSMKIKLNLEAILTPLHQLCSVCENEANWQKGSGAGASGCTEQIRMRFLPSLCSGSKKKYFDIVRASFHFSHQIYVRYSH